MILKNIKKINVNNKKGFTLLFAILVSILILAVGASIINIALKQVILSGAGRESQFAFYAANTGMECALFWDLNGATVDGAGVAKYIFPPPDSPGSRRDDLDSINCSGTNITTGSSIYSQSYTAPWVTETNSTTFRIAISNSISGIDNTLYCAEVTVDKEVINNAVYTTITSQGLNTCDPDSNSRAVQRGLVLQYRS